MPRTLLGGRVRPRLPRRTSTRATKPRRATRTARRRAKPPHRGQGEGYRRPSRTSHDARRCPGCATCACYEMSPTSEWRRASPRSRAESRDTNRELESNARSARCASPRDRRGSRRRPTGSTARRIPETGRLRPAALRKKRRGPRPTFRSARARTRRRARRRVRRRPRGRRRRAIAFGGVRGASSQRDPHRWRKHCRPTQCGRRNPQQLARCFSPTPSPRASRRRFSTPGCARARRRALSPIPKAASRPVSSRDGRIRPR
mmetsp:Transcript_740/g.2851  ORF Transcript_740/g.2851 Transcript_740/m.2851 type:complete len:260 (-) Transcript_740:626-1405(-)